MKIDLNNSTSAHASLKGSPYSLRQVTLLRGYIPPSD